MKKPVFTLKTYGAQLYKWSPESADKKILKKDTKVKFCNAVPYSQGQDWVTNYVYDLKLINNQQERIAYVECDYVE
jgi:hypothetical protein